MSCGVGRRCGLGLVLLWLWCRPGAAAPIRPLAWEPLHAAGSALKRQKTKTNQKTKTTKHTITIWPNNPISKYIPQKLKAGTWTDTCRPMFTAALDKQIYKMWHLHTMEYYSASKRNEFLEFPSWRSGNKSNYYPWRLGSILGLAHGLRIWCFPELWYRSRMQLRSGIAVAVA